MMNNSTTNVSVKDKDYGVVMKTSFGIIASLSFFGNLFLCLVMFMKRSMLRKPYNILIASLAVTDMLTGMLCEIIRYYLNLCFRPTLNTFVSGNCNPIHC